MTARTTAEIVAELRASISEPRLGRDRTSHEKLCAGAADRLDYLGSEVHRLAMFAVQSASRPPCPTCGGEGFVHSVIVEGHQDDCPDCVDGKVSIERLVAVFNAVHDRHQLDTATLYHLRSVRP